MGRNVACNLKKYINKKHYTTGVTPNEAKRYYNKLKVWLNIKNAAEFSRTYPPLSAGSFVRIFEPPKHKNGYTSVWSSKVYKITFMNGNGYLIDDYYKRKVFQRNELLKVEGAEGKD